MKSYEVSAFDGSVEMVKLARARSPKVAVSHHGFDVFTAAGRRCVRSSAGNERTAFPSGIG